jgi:phage terminase large subunit-like protein
VTTYTTHGPQVAKFFGKYLHHRKGVHATEFFHPELWQRDFLDEFYELDDAGRRIYKYGYLGIPRGNGKSPLAAGLGLYELLINRDAPDVFTVAGSKDQARILQDFARGFVEDHEQLGGPNGRGWIEPSVNFLRCHENHGVMRVLASTGLNLHGLNPTAALIDEIHAFVNGDQEEVFNAMITALHKRPNSYMLAITTAGYDKTTLLGRAYDSMMQLEDGEDLLGGCLRIRRDRENGVLAYWYGIPETLADDWQNEELWRLVNPASWVHMSDLRKQLHAPGFHELDFKRLHLNMWTATRDSWLPSGLWASLRSDAEIPDGAEVYVGVDVGQYHDTTAVSWAYKQPDSEIVIVRTHVWSVLPDLPHDSYVPGGRMQLALVGEYLKLLAERYRVAEIVFDPALFAAEADRLAEEGLPLFMLGQGTTAMNEAYQLFYQGCREAHVAHNGDKVLSAHIEAAAADMTERGWKVRKLKSTNVIDACTAAVMAHYRARRSDAPSIYERQGLFLLGGALGDDPDKDSLRFDPDDLEPGELDDEDEDDDD